MRILAWKIVLAVLVAAALFPVARGGELKLRCRWVCPNTRSILDVSFLNNPLLAVLPGENLEVTVNTAIANAKVTLIKDGKPYREDAILNFTAPEKPGTYYIPLALSAGDHRKEMELCVFIPYKGVGKPTDTGFDLSADNQPIGHYRHPNRSGNPKVRNNPDSYQPPVWWMRITDLNRNYQVIPGLAAGELVVPSENTGKQHTDMIPVCYPMWRTIHTLRQALETKGIPGSALKLISMFRAPGYNRSIGSNAFGRHIYGDAFDFYIDIEGDGKASDLNRDGKLDRRDAYIIISLIEDLQADGKIPKGGIGVYNSIGGDHVVTMHLDMRGHRATWGYVTSVSGKRSEFSWASRRFADVDAREEEAAAARAAKEGRKYYKPRRDPLP